MIAQIVAAGIFAFMFGLIIQDKIERHLVTLGCGAMTLIFVFGICMRSVNAVKEALSLHSFASLEFWYAKGSEGVGSTGINWETIVFIAGMMIMVEGMARAGFFRWLCISLASMVNYRSVPLFLAFMVISAVLSMFIDSITVILFLSAVTVELAQLLKLNPIPMILAEIFCANLGGSATMCGDPPNIIIGTSLGYSFWDFLSNTGMIAAVSLLVMLVYFYLCFRKDLKVKEDIDPSCFPDPKSMISSPREFYLSGGIFLLAVILLVSHSATGLTVSAIGVMIAILTLAAAGRDWLVLLKKLDYKTLLFFVGLFVVVSGLEQTGVLVVIAELIGKLSGGNLLIMTAIIIWISGLASAFVDNIPFAATMIPVIKALSSVQGVDISILAWSLAVGTDIGGSATPIGASANVVGTSVAAREGYPISWGKYCLYMAPASVLVLVIANVMIWLRYCL